MFCINCGTANQDGAKICINCAQSLGEVHIERRLSRRSAKKFDFFDLSFSRFVSPKMTKFLYPLSIFLAGLIGVLLIVAGFKTSIRFGIFALLFGAPLLFLLTVISSRVLLETILILFRIADRVTNMGAANIALPATEEKPDSRDGIQWHV